MGVLKQFQRDSDLCQQAESPNLCPPRRDKTDEREIPLAFERMEQALSNVERGLEVLGRRLGPTLNGSPVDGAENARNEKADTPGSEFAALLFSAGSRLGRLARMLESLDAACQL